MAAWRSCKPGSGGAAAVSVPASRGRQRARASGPRVRPLWLARRVAGGWIRAGIRVSSLLLASGKESQGLLGVQSQSWSWRSEGPLCVLVCVEGWGVAGTGGEGVKLGPTPRGEGGRPGCTPQSPHISALAQRAGKGSQCAPRLTVPLPNRAPHTGAPCPGLALGRL